MSGTWYFARHKQKLGPFSWNQLRQLATFGLLQRTDHILEDGTPRWREASSVEGLFPREQTAVKEYRLAIGGKSCGPYTTNQVRTFLMSGGLTSETLAHATDTTKWVPLAQMPEFAAYVPATTSSQAVLVMEKDRELSKEEAELYLAGKQGDNLARLIVRLMELKRKYTDNSSLEHSLDRNIKDLLALRAQGVPQTNAKTGTDRG